MLARRPPGRGGSDGRKGAPRQPGAREDRGAEPAERAALQQLAHPIWGCARPPVEAGAAVATHAGVAAVGPRRRRHRLQRRRAGGVPSARRQLHARQRLALLARACHSRVVVQTSHRRARPHTSRPRRGSGLERGRRPVRHGRRDASDVGRPPLRAHVGRLARVRAQRRDPRRLRRRPAEPEAVAVAAHLAGHKLRPRTLGRQLHDSSVDDAARVHQRHGIHPAIPLADDGHGCRPAAPRYPQLRTIQARRNGARGPGGPCGEAKCEHQPGSNCNAPQHGWTRRRSGVSTRH
mmetsp:Transcript_24639/g.77418  ORF Transcript_24639/g.77418 Transcript_24639/m.77418 type:complete len:292 (+) Transcript_24639:101-976(+)